MALSPPEEGVLTAIENQIHVEDPKFAAALGRAPSPPFRESSSPLSSRHLFQLLAVLAGVVAVAAFFAEQLGIIGVGVLTCIAVVPWLVGTARSVGRRPLGGKRPEGRAGTSNVSARDGSPVRRARRRCTLPLAVVLFAVVPVVVALVLIPPVWQALVLTVVMVPLLPWLVLRIVERVEKRTAPTSARCGGHLRQNPSDPT
jgi:DUF3040 family protein